MCDGCAHAYLQVFATHIDRLERDLADYRERVATLTERTRNMTSAATNAAASTVKAIERIQEMEPVVKAAEKWFTQKRVITYFDNDLLKAVETWLDKRKTDS